MGGALEEALPNTDVVPTAEIALFLQYFFPKVWKCIEDTTRITRMTAPYAYYLIAACAIGIVAVSVEIFKGEDGFFKAINHHSDEAFLVLFLVALATSLFVIKKSADKAEKKKQKMEQRKLAAKGKLIDERPLLA